MSDFSFAQKPSEDGSSSSVGVGVFEVESGSSNDSSNNRNNSYNDNSGRPKFNGKRIKNIGKKVGGVGKKVGGALQKINVVKWIGDLEQDQQLADQLNSINAENDDEKERQAICREAMEACMKSIQDHLLDFLAANPQGSYEEWICQLHPENINGRLEGLTQTPMIDHRFYVADSDHRILWNEHLNDLVEGSQNDMTPVRHFVAARSFQSKSDIGEGGGDNDKSTTATDVGTGKDTTSESEQQQQSTASAAAEHDFFAVEQPMTASNDNSHNSSSAQLLDQHTSVSNNSHGGGGGAVDLLS